MTSATCGSRYLWQNALPVVENAVSAASSGVADHGAGVLGLADGPTEGHEVTVAPQMLRDYKPSDDLRPTEWIPKKLEAAKDRFAEYLEHEVGNL